MDSPEQIDLIKKIASSEKERMEEEWTRPRVEIWPDPFYDEWVEWVQSHERRKAGNPVDLCEIMVGMRASPLCPVGYH